MPPKKIKDSPTKQPSIYTLPFGKRVKARRKQLGITGKELAEKLDVSWSYISKIERLDFVPSTPLLISLAKALKEPENTYVSLAATKKLKELSLFSEYQKDEVVSKIYDLLIKRETWKQLIDHMKLWKEESSKKYPTMDMSDRDKSIAREIRILKTMDTEIIKFIDNTFREIQKQVAFNSLEEMQEEEDKQELGNRPYG